MRPARIFDAFRKPPRAQRTDTIKRRGMDITTEIAKFDGKDTDILESIAARFSPDTATVQTLYGLAREDEPKLQSAATWLLKRIREDGWSFSRAQVDAVLALFDDVTHWEAKLHLLQMMEEFTVPEKRAVTMLNLLKGEGYLGNTNKFVRAWSYNGAAALATQHPALRREVAELLKAGRQDAAASVKARLRNIMKVARWADDAGHGGRATPPHEH